MSPKRSPKKGKPAKAKRRPGRPPSPNPKNRKVTARFSDEEFEMLQRVCKKRGEQLSSLVRSLVVDTIEEVRVQR